MGGHLRIALVCSGVLALAAAVVFCVVARVTASTSPSSGAFASCLFLGAVAAAIGAATLWGAVSGEIGAMAGGALTLVVFYALLALSLLLIARQDGSAGASVGAFSSAAAALVFAAVFRWLRRYALVASKPLPALVRVSYAGYSVALVLVGLALLLRVPDAFPLSLSPIDSALIGSFFVGAACYFAFALRRPSWGNATGQLWAFLAYDVVLILPFLMQFSHVTPGHLASLIVNTAVLIFSGVFSVCYLRIRLAPSVRHRRRRRHRRHQVRVRSSFSVERREIEPVSSRCS